MVDKFRLSVCSGFLSVKDSEFVLAQGILNLMFFYGDFIMQKLNVFEPLSSEDV